MEQNIQNILFNSSRIRIFLELTGSIFQKDHILNHNRRARKLKKTEIISSMILTTTV